MSDAFRPGRPSLYGEKGQGNWGTVSQYHGPAPDEADKQEHLEGLIRAEEQRVEGLNCVEAEALTACRAAAARSLRLLDNTRRRRPLTGEEQRQLANLDRTIARCDERLEALGHNVS